MLPFTSVHIIYNPKSTGASKANAQELLKKLQSQIPSVPCKIIATKYAGHAEKLAHNIAVQHNKPLIVSSSGDGGYSEVINGIMQAGTKAKHPLCAVLASGNANDHSRTMQTRPLWQAISEGHTKPLDVLRITVTHGADIPTVRYAHSYAGLGITPVVAKEVNANSYNRLQELKAVFKVFYAYIPVEIKHAGTWHRYDDIVFSNINQMAKVFKLTKYNNPSDGFFRVVYFPHTKKRYFAIKIVKAMLGKTDKVVTTKKYSFSIKRALPMQVDGEVLELPSGSTVTVEVLKHGLTSVL